jgi:DNA-binding protein H-NS
MGTTVALDKRHFKAAAEKARELGKTPETFIESLIDAASLTFDEVLAPVRKGFAASGISEEELDEVVAKARKAIHARSRRKTRK